MEFVKIRDIESQMLIRHQQEITAMEYLNIS